jgi:hypothetical protein
MLSKRSTLEVEVQSQKSKKQMQNQTKNCQNCKKEFNIEPEDFLFYEKMKVPAPTFCPECRMIRRFNLRNEKILFRRIDKHDGKEIFSGFSPDAPAVTYENNFWFGGDWDSSVNGMDYDFDVPFFTQYKKLLSVAPIPSRSVFNMINSDYCNEASETKNSYLCFNTDYLENCAYLRKVRGVKDSFDCYEVHENELCYENILANKCYQTFFSVDCENCVDVWFSKALRGCTNCFGCVNLKGKSYYFFNEPCTKEDYFEKLKNFTSGSYTEVLEMKKKVSDFWMQFPNKYYHGLRVLNSTGERIFDSKNVKNSYYIKDAENLNYCQDVWSKTSNSYDYSVWGDGAENMYECMTCGLGCYNLKFCFNCWENVSDLEYSGFCFSSKNCFGCVGLYKKEYCILNKQYSKDEYFLMRDKIVAQMNDKPYIDSNNRIYKYGEFFPFDMSLIAYNESLAHDFFPETETSAKEKGYTWRNGDVREYQTTINAIDLKDNIADIDDSVLKEVIKCEKCTKAYRIIPIELQFYKRIGLPLPHLCHNCRFTERFKLVNPPKLWHRKCMNGGCVNEFETSYDPKNPDIVYCESCYQQEII